MPKGRPRVETVAFDYLTAGRDLLLRAADPPRKDKPLVERLLTTWDSPGLARVAERAGSLERKLMSADAPPPAEALGEELLAIAKAARRR